MAETKRQAHKRLQARTDELKEDHAALSRDRAPFDQADHDRHNENLRQHKEHLLTHKHRPGD